MKNKLKRLSVILFVAAIRLCADNFVITDAVNDVGANDRINFTKLQASGLTDGLSISYSCTKDIGISEKDKNIFLFIDTDLNPGTGYRSPVFPSGADYMLQGDILYKFSGQNANEWKWTKAEVLQNIETRNKDFAIFVPFRALNISPNTPVSLFVLGKNDGGTDDMTPEPVNGPLHLITGEDIECPPRDFVTTSNTSLEFTDITGDSIPNSHADFLCGKISCLNGELLIEYTTSGKADWNKHSSSYKLFIDRDDYGKTGFRLFDDPYTPGAEYMLQGNTLFRFSGKNNSSQWEWKKIYELPYKITGNTYSIKLKLSDIQKIPGRIRFQFRADDGAYYDFMPERKAGAMVLTPGNMASGAGTRMNTSNAHAQYTPYSLIDGQVSRRLPWAISAWASAEDNNDKWIEFNFKKTETPRIVKIYWEKTSKKVSIQYYLDNKWKTVKDFSPAGKTIASSCIELPETEAPISSMRILQRKEDGPEERTDILWVREIEIY